MMNTGAGGAFAPFVPRSYWVTRATRPIGAPQYLVLDSDLLYAVALRKDLSRYVTDNGHYTFIELPGDGVWAHSALSGLSSGWVVEGSKLTVFDSTLCAQKQLPLKLKAYAGSSGGTLIVTVGDQSVRFPLGTAESWVQHTFDIPGDGQNVTVQLAVEGSACVSTYLVG